MASESELALQDQFYYKSPLAKAVATVSMSIAAACVCARKTIVRKDVCSWTVAVQLCSTVLTRPLDLIPPCSKID